MATRQVTHTQKDMQGAVARLCNPAEDWSPRSIPEAIDEILDGRHDYVVDTGEGQVEVVVMDDPYRRYLRTRFDQTERNHLELLPEC